MIMLPTVGLEQGLYAWIIARLSSRGDRLLLSKRGYFKNNFEGKGIMP